MPESRNQEKNKKIYILLSKTGTMPSNLIQLWTKKPYVHASISFDENLDEMYSFARKLVYYPFYSGFITEDIEKGVFARYKKTECMVRTLDVTEDEFRRIRDEVYKVKERGESYGYNYLGVILMAFNIPISRKRKFFCSEFVYKMLENAGMVNWFDTASRCTPDDFRISEEFDTIYEGKLTEYRKTIMEKSDVMNSAKTCRELANDDTTKSRLAV